MDKAAALEAIARFQKAIEARGISIDKLVLYGSYARGDFREGSDIDLIVISNDFKKRDYWERIELLSDAIYEVFEPIEVVGFTPEEWEKKESPLVDYARHGEVIFAV
ncbi:MAG TPA: nucleotidyltransferase domain-containing protein [Deltaproteobacteria bacterium]|nr:nucleotidyltransferase domain-containing protein [Deltaproteobacteria bacterium]